MNAHGKAWCFGDNIDTDQIIAPPHLIISEPTQMAKHTLEVVDPKFAASVKPGDIVVGARNFGCGSSREQAVAVLKTLGVGAVIADSFARIFYRNCINVGLPIIEAKGIHHHISQGDELTIDICQGTITNLTTGHTYQGIKLPDFLLEIIQAGGLLAYDIKNGI